ncbi:MAG: GTP-binding protein [Candidatus Colwellbacteria bacterium]|nr:GTP-binding protein [Candidatus Colwellbacteria bacterium]
MTPVNDNFKPRPPIVAVVGHVDHGKTAFLDYVRKTNVVEGEAGGITQSIGAYEAEHKGKKITFIDTPGHEAFSRMRAHGASAADIAILIVSADEGVKPQTEEALETLKTTNTPFVVAITKIDKENANIEKVKNDLMNKGIMLEGLGGDISWQAISSKTGVGTSELLDLLLLMGEVAELRYDPSMSAAGFVIESRMDPRRGMVAHLIIKEGVLRQGDDIKTPSVSGKVKIMENFLGKPTKELHSSSPALIVGLNGMPKGGEEFVSGNRELSIESVQPAAAIDEVVSVEGSESPKAILRADTNGSLEALRKVFEKEVEIVDASVGDIVDSDAQFAKSTGAIIIGFMVRAEKSAIHLAEVHGIKIFTSKIIYELLDLIKKSKADEKQGFAGGELKVLAVFSATPSRQTVGGKVIKGILKTSTALEIEREKELMGKGRIKSLECGKESVNEVSTDQECGLVVETAIPIQVGDLLKIIR